MSDEENEIRYVYAILDFIDENADGDTSADCLMASIMLAVDEGVTLAEFIGLAAYHFEDYSNFLDEYIEGEGIGGSPASERIQ